jgi:ketopantoate hydroxymethyltransferase
MAVEQFINQVRSGVFPSDTFSYKD